MFSPFILMVLVWHAYWYDWVEISLAILFTLWSSSDILFWVITNSHLSQLTDRVRELERKK